MISMQFSNLASDVCNCLASMAIIIKQVTNVHA